MGRHKIIPPSDAEWRSRIFEAYGIEGADQDAWQECPPAKIVPRLRQNAGYSAHDLTSLLGVTTRERVRQLETSHKSNIITRVATVLKPLLDEAARNHFALDKKDKKEFGRALGAMLEFLNLGQDIFAPDIFSVQENTSRCIHGDTYVSFSKIRLIPPCIEQAYGGLEHRALPPEIRWLSQKELVCQGMTPDEAAFHSVQAFKQQGQKLAKLDKNYLRAGLMRLMQEKGEKQNFMQKHGGPSFMALNQFLNNSGCNHNLSTFLIAKTAHELGVPDIFTLEDMGKAVYEQTTGPGGRGADKLGKPLPDEPGSLPTAGDYFVRAAAKRLAERSENLRSR